MYGFILTTAGEQLLARASAGETLTITGVQVGSGAVQSAAQAKALTALIAPKGDATSTVPAVKDGQVSMLAQYSNDVGGGLEEGFLLAELGVFARLGDGEAALFLYAALGERAQPVAPFNEGLDVHRFPLSWAVTDGVQVTLGYPAGAFISAETLEDYVPQAEKGAPGGVAALGDDGRIAAPQLPEGSLRVEGAGGVAALPISATWTDVAYGGGKFVAINNDGAIAAYSEDGINWTQTKMTASASWSSVTYGGGKFVAVPFNNNIAVYSEDGITWTQTTLPSIAAWTGITYGNGKFVAVEFTTSTAAYSSDGIYWYSKIIDSGGADVTDEVAAALQLDEKADKSVTVAAMLTAAGWSGSSPWTQTVTVAGLTSSSNGIVGPSASITDAQFTAMQAAALRPSAQAENSLTIKATGTKPTVSLPIQVVIVG